MEVIVAETKDHEALEIALAILKSVRVDAEVMTYANAILVNLEEDLEALAIEVVVPLNHSKTFEI